MLEYEFMNYSNIIKLSEKLRPIYSTQMLYIVGQAYLFKHKFYQAKKLFNRLCEIDSSPKYQFALALAYIGARQTSLAIETVQTNSKYLKLITYILNEKSISKNTLSKEFLSMKNLFENDKLALFKVLDICLKKHEIRTVEELLPVLEASRNLRKDFYKIQILIQKQEFKIAEEQLINLKKIKSFEMLLAELLDHQERFEELEKLLEQLQQYEKFEYEQCCYHYARIFEHKKDIAFYKMLYPNKNQNLIS